MFEKIFKKAATVIAHRAGPYAVERERYLEYCAGEGYSLAYLTNIAPVLLAIAHELRDYANVILGEEEIQAATQRANQLHREFSKYENIEAFSEVFAREARRWLRFLGRYQETEKEPSPFAEILDQFTAWMEHERGLARSTIYRRLWQIGRFLSWFDAKKRPFRSISLTDVDEYQAACKAKGLSRVTISIMTCDVRVFLKYAGAQGWCSRSLGAAIQSPKIYSHETIPAGPTWDEVKRLIKCLDTNDPLAIRDRAIIMLLSIYGLRASDVSGLMLKDIDWDNDLLTITRSKQRHVQLYPLVSEVGQAIVRYLKEARPKCKYKELFLTMLPPLQPLSPRALYAIVARHMKRFGIESHPHHGPHALRHACAGRLISKGLTLKEIGDHLGHKMASSTRIYAKVDLSGLREVASFDLGGVL
jgi:integrase/recombinase XerD